MLAALLALAFAHRLWFLSQGLDGKRFFDERFSFRNVSVLLGQHPWGRLSAFYPSLSFVPQAIVLWLCDRLYRLTGSELLRVFPVGGGDFTPTAYFVVRALSAAFGIASLYLLYRIGSRLVSPAVGLLAALVFAATPRHVYASSIFKPDILVVLLLLLTFSWSLDALESGSRRRFWLAGCGVGLAVSAKYTGIAAAGPAAFAVLASHWRQWRRWQWLLEMGAASVLTFALLNPYVAVILRFLPRLWRISRDKGVEVGVTGASVLRSELDFLLFHHTAAVFALAVVGAAALLWGCLRHPRAAATVPVAMTFTVVVGYSMLWVGVRFFRGLYFLPVAAFTSLYAAWTLWRLGTFALARVPPGPRPTVAWWLAGLTAAALLVHPLTWSYRECLPSTWELAGSNVERGLPAPLQLRSVLVDIPPGTGKVQLAAHGATLYRRVTSLSDLPPTADVEIFPASRLLGPSAASYRHRVEAPQVRLERVRASWFRSYGPELVVLRRRWEPSGPQTAELRDGGGAVLSLAPPPLPGELASLALHWRRCDGAGVPRGLLVPAGRLPLLTLAERPRAVLLTTARFPLAAADRELTVALPREGGARRCAATVSLWRWRPAAAAAAGVDAAPARAAAPLRARRGGSRRRQGAVARAPAAPPTPPG